MTIADFCLWIPIGIVAWSLAIIVALLCAIAFAGICYAIFGK